MALIELTKQIRNWVHSLSLNPLYILVLFSSLSPLTYGQNSPAIDARADQILRQMGEYLKSATEFTFTADITYDTLTEDGQKILFGAELNVAVRRPDLVHVEFIGT